MLLPWAILGGIALVFILIPLLLMGVIAYNKHNKRKRRKHRRRSSIGQTTPWDADPGAYFRIASATSEERRFRTAEDVLSTVNAQPCTKFNAHIAEAKGLAIYGCGILAAAHVGALKVFAPIPTGSWTRMPSCNGSLSTGSLTRHQEGATHQQHR